jgi:hypothetical protein
MVLIILTRLTWLISLYLLKEVLALYKVIFMISGHDFRLNFNKVKAIEPYQTNPSNSNDKLVLISNDDGDYRVYLSDIVMIIDNDGNKYMESENILALLEGLR